MEEIEPGNVWAIIVAIMSAIVLIGNAATNIAKAVKAAQSPNKQQNDRLDALEAWRKDVDKKLGDDLKRFEEIGEGNRVTQRALLALLDHGIDGNNVKQMQLAKEELQNHLINR